MICRFIDTDACEVDFHTPKGDKATLVLYRANMGPGHGWHAVWLRDADGNTTKAPECFTPDEKMLEAIRTAEAAR